MLKNKGSEVYEVGYLLIPTVAEDKVLGEVSKIKDFIDKNKGAVISEGNPEMRNLAYPMVKKIATKNQKFNNAYFGWIKFETESDKINEIKAEVEKLENILRFLVIKTIRENTMISVPKAGKFSFDKEDGEVAEENNTEDTKEDSEADEKELDETIDELVIE